MHWHTSRDRFAPGDSIAPGSWGRVIRTMGAAHPAWAREQLLERVRRTAAPDAPARLAAAFAHADLAAARPYAEAAEHIYQVSVAGPATTLDMVWITWIRESIDAGDPMRAERQAVAYWEGQSTADHLAAASPHWEVLTTHDLRVSALVDREAQ